MVDTDSASDSGHRVGVGGTTTVEVVDLHKKGTLPEGSAYVPEEKSYKEVHILESGWVRCVLPDDDSVIDDDETSVDYYPPERVNGIFTVEKTDD